MKTICIFFSVEVFFSMALAQTNAFELLKELDVSDGLPSNDMYEITIDRHDRKWLGLRDSEI